MENLKNYNDFNKINEEFQIFGMDVVITLGELVGAATTLFAIAGVGAFFGYISLKSWIRELLSDRKRIKALKRLGMLLEKYKDETINDYMHTINTQIHRIKKDMGRDKSIENYYTKLATYLREKMTDEDKMEYDALMDEIGMWGRDYKVGSEQGKGRYSHLPNNFGGSF